MGKKDEGGDFDYQMVRALAHPLRVLILRLLEEGPSSPKRLSERTGEPLGNFSYHMKVLTDYGCIELAEVRPVRGAVEHIYKLKPNASIGSGVWKEVPAALQTYFVGSALAAFTERAIDALEAGTVDSRKGSGINWFPLIVDEEGWGELRQVVGSVERRFRSVADKSAERLESPKDGTPVMVAVAAFEIADGKGVEPS